MSEFLAATADLKTDDGCRRVVRDGHLPERQIMTGIGPVAVRQPRVRDREAGADDSARIRFTPAILRGDTPDGPVKTRCPEAIFRPTVSKRW